MQPSRLSRNVAALSLACALVAVTRPTFADDEPIQGRRARPPKYREDEPIPPGYHVETKPRIGLIVAGGIVSGLGLTIVGVGYGEAATKGTWSDGDELAVAFGAVVAAGGLGLLLPGLLSSRKVLVRDDASHAPRWFAAPLFGAGLGGASVGATF